MAIVGGGLVGSLLAVFLSRRGHEVVVVERRPDARRGPAEAGRSINLVLTRRGIHALREVGLAREAFELTVPVLGRTMHALDGSLAFQPYGRDETECNYSISRSALNEFLVQAAESAGASFVFRSMLVAADLDDGRLEFETPDAARATLQADTVFGADGAGSAMRRILMQREGFSESVALLDHGYKELEIPALDDGGYRIDRQTLHIWPRGDIMLMALPNLDGSFTVTLYLPRGGEQGFDRLRQRADVRDLFARQFPDAVALIPDLERAFLDNPTGELGTVRCQPWHLGGQVQLIGDAAHGIVPFFGQGMNSGFEDCTVLGRILDAQPTRDWRQAFTRFSADRKPDADAIADMALDNFVEMRDRVADPAFLLRKRVEQRLEQVIPDLYRSRYSMVMYSQIPFAVAQQAGRIQAEILEQLCRSLDSADALDLGRARQRIEERLTPFLQRHGVTLDY